MEENQISSQRGNFEYRQRRYTYGIDTRDGIMSRDRLRNQSM